MIEFIGPLPPPQHGFAWVNQQMLAGLQALGEVRVRDRAKPRLGEGGVMRKLLLPAFALFQWMPFIGSLVFGRPRSVYLCCSGGIGMVIDTAFVLAARMFRVPVFIHHHAFSYLNDTTALARFCLARMRTCSHVVLCEQMGAMLSRVHTVPLNNVIVLSNAAFLSDSQVSQSANFEQLSVGFLSNITAEKGIFDFFNLAERFAGSANSPKFLIAGPVGKGVRQVFDSRLASLLNVRHVGPVYGEEKSAFYSQLDVLVFPSRNEAEPLTILEAFRVGVPVIANHTGCIATMIDQECGHGVLLPTDFVGEAEAFLLRLSNEPNELLHLKCGALQRFAQLRALHSNKLNWLLQRISQGLPFGSNE